MTTNFIFMYRTIVIMHDVLSKYRKLLQIQGKQNKEEAHVPQCSLKLTWLGYCSAVMIKISFSVFIPMKFLPHIVAPT